MTLTMRQFGRARLADGPWTVRIHMEDGWTSEVRVILSGSTWSPDLDGLGPTWAEVDRSLRLDGYARRGSASREDPADGVEFDVVAWDHGRRHEPYARVPRGEGVATVAVSLPPTRMAEIRRALDGLADLTPWYEEAVTSLRERLDKADTVTVLLPADVAGSLSLALGNSLERATELDEGSVSALEDLHRRLEQSRPVTGPWPHVRDTLQSALREALARPGAEGLAARDELLDVVRRFTDAHRTATAADDAEQGHLQAERDTAAP